MKARTKAMLWVLLVFLIGTAFGAAVVKLSQRSLLVADNEPAVLPENVPEAPAGRRPGDSPAGLSRGMLEGMLRRLDMTPDQAVRAREILENARGDYLRIDRRRNQQQRQVRQRALGQLRDMLNPRQRRQLRQFLSRLPQPITPGPVPAQR